MIRTPSDRTTRHATRRYVTAAFGVLFLGALLFAIAGCKPYPEAENYARLLAEARRAPDLPEDFSKRVKKFLRKADDESRKLEIAYAAGRAYQKAKRWNEAVEMFERCDVAAFPVRDYARYRAAESLAAAGFHLKAAERYESLLRDFPEFPIASRVRFRIGEAYETIGRYDASLSVFESLFDDARLGRDARYHAGLAYVKLGDPQKAFEAFEKVIEEKTNDSLAPKAVEEIRRLAEAYPSLKLTRSQRFIHAKVLHGAGKREEARKVWKQVAAGHKDELATRARYEIGKSYMRDRKWRTAIRTFEEILRNGHPNYRTRALYQRILATRRSGRRTRALTLFRSFIKENPWSSLMPEVMMEYGWTLRSARDYKTARKVYADLVERYPKSRQAREAAWLVAWCDIRLGQYARSLSALNRIVDAYPNTDDAGRALFWIGKMHERLGNWEPAANAYRRVVEMATYYYVTRAEARLAALEKEGKLPPGYVATMRRTIATSSVSLESLAEMPYPRVALLQRVGDDHAVIAELEALVEKHPDQKPLLYYHLIRANENIGQSYRAYIIAYRFSRLPEVRNNGATPPFEIGRLLYPLAYWKHVKEAAEEFDLDPHFLAAMIREESRFNSEAVSWAGAYGLMQVMPETGKTIARRLGIRNFSKEMLLDPAVNIRLGAWYIRFLLDKFDGDLSLVSGAYNAGEGRMESWQRKYRIDDIDEFIEQVPFDETRNHIKKVMHAYHVYRNLYGDDLQAGEVDGGRVSG